MAIRTANSPAETPAETSAQVTEPEIETTAVPETKPEVPVVQSAFAPPAVSTGAAAPTFESLRNRLDPVSYGNIFPRIVPGPGLIQTDSKIQLGTYIDIQVVSISDRWMYAPEADMKKDPGSKNYCRASYDGKNIPDRDGGPSMTLAEYEEFAAELRRARKEEPYTRWKLSKYLDIFGVIFNAEPSKLEIAMNLNMVQASVSITAIKGFNAFFVQSQLSVARGRLPADKQNCMRIGVKAMTNNRGDDYSILIPELVPLDILAKYTPVAM